MSIFLSSSLKKFTVSIALGCLAYFIAEWSDFYYLFTANIFLTFGFLFFVEALFELIFWMFHNLRERSRNIRHSIRITFILLFIAEILIRFSGMVQTYPERTDGRYFSGARAEKLNSWYWVHPPNDTINNVKKEFVFYRTTNSLGLSEKEISDKKDSSIRILALGDSFTEGVGLAYEKTWVKQMETRWRNKNVETVNAGIGGSDPVYEFALYRDKLTNAPSDIVILTINSTDIMDISSRGGFERFKVDGTAGSEPPRWEWIYASNHMVRMFMNGVLGYSSDLSRNSHSEGNQKQAVKVLKDVFDQLRKLTNERKAKLLIVFQPSIGSFDGGLYSPFFGQEELKKYLKSKKIEFVDASQAFVDKGSEVPAYFWPLDTHFNEKGYGLFGQTIYEKIEELKWLESDV